MSASTATTATRLTVASAAASVALAVGLLLIYLFEGSLLAAAQAADSAADVLLALGLVASVLIARQPPDGSHHFGHGQAEPLAALVAAFVAAQLGITVSQAAVSAFRDGGVTELSELAVVVFTAKVVVKVIIWSLATRGRAQSSALDALAIDARNDVMVGAVAILGYVGVNAGYPRLDAVLALPVGLVIVYGAIMLAVRSVKLLMGAAPDDERQDELRDIALKVDGVADVEQLRARTTGAGIEVALCIGVDAELTVHDAHEIADRVESALESEADVVGADVHVHPAE